MDRLLPFDELNTLGTQIQNILETNEDRSAFREYIEDSILDLLVMSFVYGEEAANDMLGTETELSREDLEESIGKEIAGKNWIQRVSEYIDKGTAADIMRVVETDSHRIYNDAIEGVGRKAESKGEVIYKTWVTMDDMRVRDTHEYLENMTIPLGERFFTFDGDSADHPGDFYTAENNANCRCRIRLSKR